MPIALAVVAALVISVLLTGVTRKLALLHGVVDVPNERSSHAAPTPRGGGIATVVATAIALTILAVVGAIPMDVFIALAGGGGAVAVVGYFDDRHALSAKVRLGVHFAAAGWALFWLGGLPPLQFGEQVVVLGWTGYLLGLLGIVWTLNLFNFMDGIDGIAASEAIFIAGAGALLALFANTSSVVPDVALVFAAACCGFLIWNWPPAKIFMGDVGSGFLGYIIVVLAIVAARDNPIALLVWTTLGGAFFTDATVTLVRRVLRGEPAFKPHRSHAYQHLARRWGSHLRVTLAVLAVNVFFLFPCAVLATRYPQRAGYVLLAAVSLLTVVVLTAGAGRHESASAP
jgi:Fuc2NAc and GlcNAc transferase